MAGNTHKDNPEHNSGSSSLEMPDRSGQHEVDFVFAELRDSDGSEVWSDLSDTEQDNWVRRRERLCLQHLRREIPGANGMNDSHIQDEAGPVVPQVPVIVKRGRGRPRKIQRGPGRPRRSPAPEGTPNLYIPSHAASTPASAAASSGSSPTSIKDPGDIRRSVRVTEKLHEKEMSEKRQELVDQLFFAKKTYQFVESPSPQVLLPLGAGIKRKRGRPKKTSYVNGVLMPLTQQQQHTPPVAREDGSALIMQRTTSVNDLISAAVSPDPKTPSNMAKVKPASSPFASIPGQLPPPTSDQPVHINWPSYSRAGEIVWVKVRNPRFAGMADRFVLWPCLILTRWATGGRKPLEALRMVMENEGFRFSPRKTPASRILGKRKAIGDATVEPTKPQNHLIPNKNSISAALQKIHSERKLSIVTRRRAFSDAESEFCTSPYAIEPTLSLPSPDAESKKVVLTRDPEASYEGWIWDVPGPEKVQGLGVEDLWDFDERTKRRMGVGGLPGSGFKKRGRKSAAEKAALAAAAATPIAPSEAESGVAPAGVLNGNESAPAPPPISIPQGQNQMEDLATLLNRVAQANTQPELERDTSLQTTLSGEASLSRAPQLLNASVDSDTAQSRDPSLNGDEDAKEESGISTPEREPQQRYLLERKVPIVPPPRTPSPFIDVEALDRGVNSLNASPISDGDLEDHHEGDVRSIPSPSQAKDMQSSPPSGTQPGLFEPHGKHTGLRASSMDVEVLSEDDDGFASNVLKLANKYLKAPEHTESLVGEAGAAKKVQDNELESTTPAAETLTHQSVAQEAYLLRLLPQPDSQALFSLSTSSLPLLHPTPHMWCTSSHISPFLANKAPCTSSSMYNAAVIQAITYSAGWAVDDDAKYTRQLKEWMASVDGLGNVVGDLLHMDVWRVEQLEGDGPLPPPPPDALAPSMPPSAHGSPRQSLARLPKASGASLGYFNPPPPAPSHPTSMTAAPPRECSITPAPPIPTGHTSTPLTRFRLGAEILHLGDLLRIIRPFRWRGRLSPVSRDPTLVAEQYEYLLVTKMEHVHPANCTSHDLSREEHYKIYQTHVPAKRHKTFDGAGVPIPAPNIKTTGPGGPEIRESGMQVHTSTIRLTGQVWVRVDPATQTVLRAPTKHQSRTQLTGNTTPNPFSAASSVRSLDDPSSTPDTLDFQWVNTNEIRTVDKALIGGRLHLPFPFSSNQVLGRMPVDEEQSWTGGGNGGRRRVWGCVCGQ